MPTLRRRFGPLVVVVAAAMSLPACSDDAGRVTVADPASESSGPVGAPDVELSPEAAELVAAVTAELGLTAACTPHEAAMNIMALQGDDVPADRAMSGRIVAAYLSRECSPCFAVVSLADGLAYEAGSASDDAPAGADEVIGASVAPDLAELALRGELEIDDGGPGEDFWRANCVGWEDRVGTAVARIRSTTTTTARPPDGPNVQSYGSADDVYGQGRIVSDPDAGPPPRILWVHAAEPEAMLLDGTTVYAADLGAGVTALDVHTGEELWHVWPGGEDADSSGGVEMSFADGRLRVFVPYSYAAEIDPADGSTLETFDVLDESPWPEVGVQAGEHDGDDDSWMPNVEPRIRLDDEGFQVVGVTADGRQAFVTSGEPWFGPLPYGFRTGTTVVFSDAVGNIVAIDWP